MEHPISGSVLRRTAMYLAYLKSLDNLPDFVSAPMIAEALQLGQEQVRKDLAKIARPGQTKVGRETKALIRDMEQAVGLRKPLEAVLMGRADFLPWLEVQCADRLRLARCFPEETPPSEITAFCRENQITLAIVNVGPERLCDTAQALESSGVRAIWNFSSVPLAAREGMLIQNESLTPSLSVLSYYLANSPGNPTDMSGF